MPSKDSHKVRRLVEREGSAKKLRPRWGSPEKGARTTSREEGAEPAQKGRQSRIERFLYQGTKTSERRDIGRETANLDAQGETRSGGSVCTPKKVRVIGKSQ